MHTSGSRGNSLCGDADVVTLVAELVNDNEPLRFHGESNVRCAPSVMEILGLRWISCPSMIRSQIFACLGITQQHAHHFFSAGDAENRPFNRVASIPRHFRRPFSAPEIASVPNAKTSCAFPCFALLRVTNHRLRFLALV